MRPRRNEQVPANPENQEVEESVLERLRSGDVSALDELFHVYGDRVYGVCFAILGNTQDAEDASQDVFIRAFNNASQHSNEANFSRWLFRLASNHTLNLAKSKNRRRRISEPLEDDQVGRAQSPESSAISREVRDQITALLQQIPLEQRQVLVLREMEGLSYSELAQVLGLPIGTVTSRLIRGRERFRILAEQSEINLHECG